MSSTSNKSNAKNSSIIERIPWKKYFRQVALKIIISIIILVLFLAIVFYSSKINPDRNLSNPTNIIGIFSSDYLILILLSSILFLLVLGAFTKTLFIDHKEEFGIEGTLKTKRVFFLFLLVVSFISSVYVLLDVALKNIYMITGPINLIWITDNVIHIPLPTISDSTDRLAYAQIRTYYFFVFYLFMIFFPIIMFLSLLTRYGRNKLFKKEEGKIVEKKSQSITILGIVFGPLVILFLNNLLNSSDMTNFSRNLFGLIIAFLIVWWVYQIFRIILKGIKITAVFSYANIILFFPLLLIFYILPIILWTSWDIFKIYSMNGSTLKTIHTEMGTPLANTIINLGALSIYDLINIIFQTLIINCIAIFRIIQLDFVFIIGLSAIAIGFAEGYSIISIFSALFKGVSVARTGRIATKSSPKLIVMSSRIIMLGAWISFFWDRMSILIEIIKVNFSIYFPFDIKLPRIFEILAGLKLDLSFLGVVIPLTFLIIPLYYILISSFKFLSVSLIVERTKQDQQIFFLLISSAFVLITTNILQDITESIITTTGEIAFLPTSYANTQVLIAFGNKIFELLESGSFYFGVIVALLLLLKSLNKKYKERVKKKKLDQREKKYNFQPIET